MMKTQTMVLLSALMSILSSCDFKCSIGNKNDESKSTLVKSTDNIALNGAVIKNDIEIEATGVKVKEAYLIDANNNLLTENITGLNQRIYLIIKTDTGWIKQNGKSFLGSSERISTDEGTIVVDAPDIFKAYEQEGLPADKANVVSLSANISQADPSIKYFEVKFRVWDKKGIGEIKGKYKFKIKN